MQLTRSVLLARVKKAVDRALMFQSGSRLHYCIFNSASGEALNHDSHLPGRR